MNTSYQGTRAFQSVSVLNASLWGEYTPPQDHLDDLESFFYVLAWICLKHNGPHSDSVTSAFLDTWEAPNAHVCAGAKSNFLMAPSVALQQYFDNPIFRTLLMSLAKLCRGHLADKSELAGNRQASPALIDVHKKAQAIHHDAFLSCVDEAIEKQKKETEDWVHPPIRSPVTPPAKSVKRVSKKSDLNRVTRGGSSKNKRRVNRSNDDDDDGPGPSKRSKALTE